MWPSIMLLVIEVGSLRASDKISLCLGSQEIATYFFAKFITQNSGKLFNCGTKFNSFKPEYMVFSIPELHGITEKFPLDLDIP